MELTMKFLAIVSLLLFTTSCAGLFQERTFIKEMDRVSDGTWTPHEDFQVIPGDRHDGYRSKEQIAARTPEGRKSFAHSDNLLRELSRKEKLLTMEQYADYSELRPDLETTSEKIYYLNLDEVEKDHYLSSKHLGKYAARNMQKGRGPAMAHSARRENLLSQLPTISSLSRGGNIYQGMVKEDVRTSWGRPYRVEVAGNPRNQNEKWTFYENGKVKQVFFEGGVVHGWAME